MLTGLAMQKMVLECQQHPDYMRAVQTLLDLARQYGSHGRHMASDASGSAKGAHSGFSKAETDLKVGFIYLYIYLYIYIYYQ